MNTRSDRHPYTAAEESYLAREFPRAKSVAHVVAQIRNRFGRKRTVGSIRQKAWAMGLRRRPENGGEE